MKKKFNPFLNAVTGAAIIAAGNIAAAQAKPIETECEPWRADLIRTGYCNFKLDRPEIDIPAPTTSTNSYSS